MIPLSPRAFARRARPSSVIYVGAMLVLCALWFARARPEARRRSAVMFVVLIALSGIFTLSQVLEGGRWVSDNAQNLRHMPSPAVRAGLLAYNLMAEFAAVVMTFFALPCWLGLIKDHRPADVVGPQPPPIIPVATT